MLSSFSSSVHSDSGLTLSVPASASCLTTSSAAKRISADTPSSIRSASSFSSEPVRSGTRPISFRYIRTGSSIFTPSGMLIPTSTSTSSSSSGLSTSSSESLSSKETSTPFLLNLSTIISSNSSGDISCFCKASIISPAVILFPLSRARSTKSAKLPVSISVVFSTASFASTKAFGLAFSSALVLLVALVVFAVFAVFVVLVDFVAFAGFSLLAVFSGFVSLSSTTVFFTALVVALVALAVVFVDVLVVVVLVDFLAVVLPVFFSAGSAALVVFVFVWVATAFFSSCSVVVVFFFFSAIDKPPFSEFW